MKALMGILFVLSLLPIGSLARAQNTVFFEEQFTGPNLDPAVWRTEILTAGERWCDTYPGAWWDGTWVAEGSPCYGVAAYSPYGSVDWSDGMMHLLPTNVRACTYLMSRLPGGTPLFPALGDFTLTVRMHYDQVTAYGTGITVYQTDSTQPNGTNPPALRENVVLQLWCDGGDVQVLSTLGGSYGIVAWVPSPTEMHEFVLDCTGTSFTISVDGQVVYGPVSSGLRPTAIWMGNPALAYWGPTNWTSFSVDEVRVEVPGAATGACCFSNGVCLQETHADCESLGGNYVGDGVPCDPDPCGPTPVKVTTWGQVKALYR